jgi:MFS family permease
MFGWFGTVMGFAAAIGPVIGGGLVAIFGWRSIFLVNLPAGALALALTLRGLPREHARPRAGMSFDLPGAAAFTGFVGALVAALFLATDGAQRWLPAVAVAAILLAAFVSIERRVSDPFVALALFNRRPYVGATATVLLHNLVMYSLLLIVPVLAERELDLGPSGAGLLVGAMTGAMMLSSPVGGQMSDRLGRRVPVAIGAVIAVGATVGLVLVARSPGLGATAAFVAMAGAGIGLAGASLQTTAVESAPAGMVGVASGVFMTVRYTGGIAAAGLAAAVASSGAFATGFAVLAAAAALSLLSASALAAAPRRRGEAVTSA